MTRRYLQLALLSFISYSLVAPLIKVAMETVPSTMAVFLSNLVMLVLLAGLLVYQGVSLRPYLTHPKTPHILVWGVLVSITLLAYYRALALGPVTVVVPIYGLFIVFSSVIGILVFEEKLTRRKAAGITLAVVAILLVSM